MVIYEDMTTLFKRMIQDKTNKEVYAEKFKLFNEGLDIYKRENKNFNFDIDKEKLYIKSASPKIKDDDAFSINDDMISDDGELMIQINEITGDVHAHNMEKLKTLKGFPKKIHGDFRLANNSSLEDTEYIPEEIDGNVKIIRNTNLKSLSNFPIVIEGNFEYYGNELKFGSNEEFEEYLKSNGITTTINGELKIKNK